MHSVVFDARQCTVYLDGPMRDPNQPPRKSGLSRRLWDVAIVGILAGALAGCSSPLSISAERDLKRSVIESTRRELAEARRFPLERATVREPIVSRLNIEPGLMPDLQRMAGPQSYESQALPLDNDLLGRPQETVSLDLQRVLRTTVQNNLAIQFGRLQPGVMESQVVAAQAAFDAVLYTNIDYSNLDEPTPLTVQNFSVSGAPVNSRMQINTSSGIRRPLISGGQFTIQVDANYTDLNNPGLLQIPNPSKDLGLSLRLDQPLLRNFGSDVAQAQVRVNRNQERDAIAALKRDLIKTVTDAETAYWNLVDARYELLILQRLYERGIRVRDQVEAREILDATPAQRADARSRVERRRSDVVRARSSLRKASDALKQVMNDPDLPVGGETLVLPSDGPPDAPISFSLVDVLSTAIRSRPELQQAILAIDNTSIRVQVADNQRLPKLDLRLQTRFGGLSDSLREASSEVVDRVFIDYLAGIQFEFPIGNRAAEAQYRQRRLERSQATFAYRNAVQQVIGECKKALRDAVTGYELIEQTRAARVAETENLRSFEVEQRFLRGYDVNTLDLEFRRQESLAQSEREEMQAITEYQTSLADLYRAMGTALERSNIEFKVPDASDPLDEGGLAQPRNPVTKRGVEIPVRSPPKPAGLRAPDNR
jgi:outer membrane protein TolC